MSSELMYVKMDARVTDQFLLCAFVEFDLVVSYLNQ